MKSLMVAVRSRFKNLVQLFEPTSSAVMINDEALDGYFLRGEKTVNKESAKTVQKVLLRQISGVRTPEPYMVTKQKCKHGYFQAVVRRPVDLKNSIINSGMLRLTCPYLVKLIDDIEGQGGVKRYNEERIVGQQSILDNFSHVNDQWRLIKHAATTQEERDYVAEKLQDRADDFLNSGIIGIRKTGTRDVKCLHAHVADELIRDDNAVGQLVLADIEAAGHDPKGCSDCWQQCNSEVPKNETKWWYESVKNKSKLRQKRKNQSKFKEGKILS